VGLGVGEGVGEVVVVLTVGDAVVDFEGLGVGEVVVGASVVLKSMTELRSTFGLPPPRLRNLFLLPESLTNFSL